MLRSSCAKTFTKYLVKPTQNGGVRLALVGSTTRIRASYHVQPRFPPVFVRNYAQPPGGGFPGLTLGPQHQKGDALKEYVSHS
jgi:ATP-dependent Clp protease ATP-binding subunit ClpB